jgi:EAL domain-containing protein (putative c-di-GMP-specific phosphodiesterase class I)/ActR/RegA family two-component response regulator
VTLQNASAKAPVTTPRRVLLLDDEESVLGVLSDYLRSPHLEIVTCREIEAAEAILEHAHFDVVVTDLRVSELGGLEGIRLIRFVTTHFPGTVVLAMSGYVTEEVHAFGRAAGVTAVLEKPLDLPRLRQWVFGDIADNDEDETDEGPVADVQPLSEFIAADLVYSVYQPIIDLSVRDRVQVYGYEALARGPGDNPLRNPEILFAYATRKECLLDTDMMCIQAALRDAAPISHAHLFLNIHPRSLTAPESPSRIARAVIDGGGDPTRVVIELTEHHAIVNPEAFRHSLDELRAHGFRVAIDDFGVGYANVRLISEIRPDFIKLSGYFALGAIGDPVRQNLIGSMTKMASGLGIPVICEGIEDEEVLEIARERGVPYGQGYLFARPAPAPELAARFGPPASAGDPDPTDA